MAGCTRQETDANSLALEEEKIENILRKGVKEELQRRFWKQKVSPRLIFGDQGGKSGGGVGEDRQVGTETAASDAVGGTGAVTILAAQKSHSGSSMVYPLSPILAQNYISPGSQHL